VSSAGRGVRVRRLGGSRAGEMRLTRLLRNGAVTPDAMLAEAAARLSERSTGRPVLAIQDTTVVRSEGGGGLYLHACIALDAEDDALLGLAHAEFAWRDHGGKASYRRRPIADKQSRRWLDGADAAARACSSARTLILVGDRENDIYAAFARRPANADLLVRAGGWDRALATGELLSRTLDGLPEVGRYRVDLAAGPGRRARTALVGLRFASVTLKRPRNSVEKTALPAKLTLQAVDVREIDPPAGVEPVHWRLLTTLPVGTAAEAAGIADLYRRRWAIEQLFRTLKTQGFDIEALAIAHEGALKNLVTAALVAATIVQQLVHAREGHTPKSQAPEGDASGAPTSGLRQALDAFSPEDIPLIEAIGASLEGRTQRQKNPHPKGSLAFASWVCARLGGWTGYYGKPGPIVMLEGWFEFQSIKRGLSSLGLALNV